jgi:hypothetical protein
MGVCNSEPKKGKEKIFLEGVIKPVKLKESEKKNDPSVDKIDLSEEKKGSSEDKNNLSEDKNGSSEEKNDPSEDKKSESKANNQSIQYDDDMMKKADGIPTQIISDMYSSNNIPDKQKNVEHKQDNNEEKKNG